MQNSKPDLIFFFTTVSAMMYLYLSSITLISTEASTSFSVDGLSLFFCGFGLSEISNKTKMESK